MKDKLIRLCKHDWQFITMRKGSNIYQCHKCRSIQAKNKKEGVWYYSHPVNIGPWEGEEYDLEASRKW